MKESNLEKNLQKSEIKKNASSRNQSQEIDESYRKIICHPMNFSRGEYVINPFFSKISSTSRKPMIFNESVGDLSRPSINEQERYINNTEVRYAVDYIQKVKSYYPDDSLVFSNFLEIMKDFKQGKTSTEEVAKVISSLFKDNELLISEFKKFLPQNINYTEPYDIKLPIESRVSEVKSEKMDKDQAVEFVTLAKQRFAGDPEMYANFIKLLAFLKNKPVPEGKFRDLEALLIDYPDLLSHLHKFIPETSILKEEDNSPFNQIKEKLKQKNIYKEFIKCINAFNQNLISGRYLIFLLRPLIKDEELINELKGYIKYDEIELNSYNPKKMKLLKKIGSYRILPENCRINYEENNDVLNNICVGCPTHEREDEKYVFLKRNVYEENMFRIEDERFESDLLLTRCDTFILALEKISKRLKHSQIKQELSINDLDIPLGIVQELLEFIYGNHDEEFLEGILSKPREVIPLVLNRLYLVNKDWRNERIKKMRVWDECVRKTHYKALCSIFCDFKHMNKKDLAYKVLSKNMVGSRDISDLEIFDIVFDLIETYAKNCVSNFEEFLEVISPMLDIFRKENTTFYGDNIIFSIISYILILYERIKEVKELKLSDLTFSKLSKKMGLKQHIDVSDRMSEIFKIMRKFVAGNIEPSKYEEEIRILSDCYGYKLSNIDKILNKMENKVILLKQSNCGYELLKEIYLGTSKLEKVEMFESGENYKFVIKQNQIEIEKLINNSCIDVLKNIEKFKNLDFDQNLIKNKVFLKKSFVDFKGGKYYFDIEHRVCVKTMKLKYIAGTEDFFMRIGFKRLVKT